MKKILIGGFSMVLLAVIICSFMGCETIDGGKGLTVVPSSVTFSNEVNSVTFTAGGTATDTNGETVVIGGAGELSIPMKWTVSDPALGSIKAIAGNKAVYVSNRAKGVNVITVEDQYGAQGVATVTQR